MREIKTDYVIIGTGVAGLSCALEACKTGTVILLSKDKFPSGNTAMAQGGIAAALGESDFPELHLQDTLRAGAGFCDKNAVQVLVREGKQRVKQLIKYGFPYDRGEDGLPVFSREGAHSVSRVLSASGDSAGKALAETLLQQVRKRQNIHIYEGYTAAKLLFSGEKCAGVLAGDSSGNAIAFLCRAVVLASGGCGQVYSYTTNNLHCTGDGIALAYRAGARLQDMEFVQFHPTALESEENPVFLVSEAVRGKGGRLVDRRGRRFMNHYHAWGELAPRDVVARAIFTELQNGNRVYLDVSHLGLGFRESFPTIYRECRKRGINVPGEPIPVRPAAHFIMGGVKTDLEGFTGVKGLYACGEAACTGVHGANRLASNSLLEGLVFGFRAGRSVAGEKEAAGVVQFGGIKTRGWNLALPGRENRKKSGLLQELKKVMWENAGLSRSGEGLSFALSRIQAIDCMLEDRDIVLKNMITVAGFIARSALARRESAGSHYRCDTVREYSPKTLNYA